MPEETAIPSCLTCHVLNDAPCSRISGWSCARLSHVLDQEDVRGREAGAREWKSPNAITGKCSTASAQHESTVTVREHLILELPNVDLPDLCASPGRLRFESRSRKFWSECRGYGELEARVPNMQRRDGKPGRLTVRLLTMLGYSAPTEQVRHALSTLHLESFLILTRSHQTP